MTTGYSGTYALNGTDITLKPTSGRWVGRDALGIDGGGHPIYPSVREFEMKWDLMSQSDFAQLVGLYNLVSTTGTVTADLPYYDNSGYQFHRYSGITLQEPVGGEYFMEYVKDVTLLVLRVTT